MTYEIDSPDIDSTVEPPTDVWPANFDWHGFGFETRQVRAGEFDEQTYGARVAPIYMTSAFRFDSFQQSHERFSGVDEGQLYSRHLNPTNGVAERRIASLEGGTGAIAVASGQAAVTLTILGLVSAGEHLVSTASVYSGTKGLFDNTLKRVGGINVGYVWNYRDSAEWERAIRPETKAIFIETIPNPKNDVVDIAFVAAIARRHGLPLVVDNTVATPYLVRPFEHGANIVVHSSTKFLTGHGAALSGLIVDGGNFDWAGSSRDYPTITDRSTPTAPSFLERYGVRAFEASLRLSVVNDIGAALSPFNGFLLQQGIETLSLRMERHLDNAVAIARWLEEQPTVESVDYAGLPGNPFYDVAQGYFNGRSGAVFAFTVRGGRPAAAAFIDRLEVFSRMTNIGDVRSMVIHPASTTHLNVDPAERERLGITPGLVRLSVGIETVADLITDLTNGLESVATLLTGDLLAETH